jgi:hypothetical protein
MMGGGDSSVPKAGVFYSSLLRAEVYVGEAIALGVAFGPLEVIHEAPCVIGANFCSVGDGTGQFCEDLLVEAVRRWSGT